MTISIVSNSSNTSDKTPTNKKLSTGKSHKSATTISSANEQSKQPLVSYNMKEPRKQNQNIKQKLGFAEKESAIICVIEIQNINKIINLQE